MPAQRWKYKTVFVRSQEKESKFQAALQDEVGVWGSAGWELVAVDSSEPGGWRFFMKMPY